MELKPLDFVAKSHEFAVPLVIESVNNFSDFANLEIQTYQPSARDYSGYVQIRSCFVVCFAYLVFTLLFEFVLPKVFEKHEVD